jgi:UDP-2,4-diacetamido-2,4,6-trideoxy-beta-L-altropyranose hydrolase
MRIAIRVDSSFQIGTGHVARCLALAEELCQKGAEPEFICRDLPGNIASLAVRKGFPVHFLKTDSPEECRDLLQKANKRFHGLVMDHYQLDARYETPLRPFVNKLLIIDDLANRSHIGDVLVDPNFGDANRSRYSQLVPKECQLLMGPGYAILRKEFETARKQAEDIRSLAKPIENILVFFGGVDLTDETSKTLDVFEQLEQNGSPARKIHVVLGASNPRKDAIQKRLYGRPGYQCSVQVENMAELMVSMDLSIGAGGTASWERLCLGLPSLVISVADNQTQACIDLDRAGYLVYLGTSADVSRSILASTIVQHIARPEKIFECGRKGMQLVDGLGCRKVASAIIE